MNGWHESIKDQTPDHPDHKKPGLVKREQELDAAMLEKNSRITPQSDDQREVLWSNVRQAKKNLKRQQEVNK